MPLTNTPETLNILDPDFRMPEHCGGDRWSILHGDSLQILRQLEPNSFDAIITDPPYASGGSSQTTKNRSTSEKYSSMSKETGVQGYHLVQSFAEREVTPELAHQIGVEFAEQLLLGKYQAIVTTHLNTKHYHNHIVWSAVSLEDGKKYHSNSKSYYTEVRALSDALCQKYGLSIIETPESLRGKRQYEKWRAEKNNQPTWRTAIRQDVDDAIQQSLTWRQFLSVLERKGYEVRMGRKYPVLRPPGKERFVRFKTLGKRYTPEAIQTRILYGVHHYYAIGQLRYEQRIAAAGVDRCH